MTKATTSSSRTSRSSTNSLFEMGSHLRKGTSGSGSLHPWGKLHRLLLVEGLCQRRRHHVGITGG